MRRLQMFFKFLYEKTVTGKMRQNEALKAVRLQRLFQNIEKKVTNKHCKNSN
jgi:hypothetical protein